jgi:hypothetical protein
MNITISDVILLGHAAFGVLGCLAALWVFVDTLNARRDNASRIRNAAVVVAVCMAAAWILGGYWYESYYPAEKAMILKGPWPLAHNLLMETKEHLFFITAILALFLPAAAREKLYNNAPARRMVLSVAMLIAFTGLAVEGAGAAIDHGAKVALLRSGVKASTR